MNKKQLRQAVMAVIAQIKADHTAYPLTVETSNRDLVDQATQTDPYLQVTVSSMMGEQASLGPKPQVKYSGQILLAAVVKDGAGVADAEDLIDFVLPYFSTLAFGTLQCQAGFPTQGREFKGWWYEPAIVPFFYFAQLPK